MNTKTVNTKSAAASFLDQLIADPLNPDLCRQFGIEVVPMPAEPSIADSNHEETCWLGGECENAPDYDITHGYEGLYVETHGICKAHIAEAIENLSQPVAGWGDPLPLRIVRHPKGVRR